MACLPHFFPLSHDPGHRPRDGPAWQVTTWVYVDESKRSGYVLAATAVPDPDAARRVVRGLVLPGQRRLHMHNEQARRRGIIVSGGSHAGPGHHL